MALQITSLPRTFEIEVEGKKITLDDPGSHLTPDEVLKHYMGVYPQLTNAHVDGPKVSGGKAGYTMNTKAGTKG
jgi:PRTRC genetic system protein C